MRDVPQRSPHIDGVYAGYPDGAFFHAVNLADPAWRRKLQAPADAVMAIRAMERDESGRATARVLFFDGRGRRLEEERLEAASFDPRTRPCYVRAVNGLDPVATGPYQMASTGKLGVTVSQADKHDPRIVISADVVLTTIIALLAQERLSESSVAFITDARGRLTVHSDTRMRNRIMTALNERDFDPSRAPDLLTERLRAFKGQDGRAVTIDAGGRPYMVIATTIGTGLLFSGSRIFVAAPTTN